MNKKNINFINFEITQENLKNKIKLAIPFDNFSCSLAKNPKKISLIEKDSTIKKNNFSKKINQNKINDQKNNNSSLRKELKNHTKIHKKISNKEKENDVDTKSLKDILFYLDELFIDLPEETIKKFANSPYYNKYNDLLDILEENR